MIKRSISGIFIIIYDNAERKSFFRFKDTLRDGFVKVFGRRRFFGKLFLLAYFAISALVVVNLATFGNITNIKESEFLTMSRDLVGVEVNQNTTSADIYEIQDLSSIVSVMPYASEVSVSVKYEDLYQGSNTYQSVPLSVYPIALSEISASDLVTGSLPTDKTEVAIDKWIADALIEDKTVSDLGVTDYESLLGALIYGNGDQEPLEVVGVIETESPVIVLVDDAIFYFLEASYASYTSYGLAEGEYLLTSGRTILSDHEILANALAYTLNSTVTINGEVYTIVGLFTSTTLSSYILSNDAYTDLAIARMLNAEVDYIYFYSEDLDTAVSQIEALGFQAKDYYAVARAEYTADLSAEIFKRIQYIGITLAGIVAYIFLMMRSSVLGRIKEIGIYRAIGATKRDIYKIYFSEILAMTTIGSLTGYLFMTYIVNQVEKALGGFVSIFYFPLYLFAIGILMIYAVNIVFGMIPIFSLLRKTPAEINAKFDI